MFDNKVTNRGLSAKFLLVLASVVVLGSESHGTHDHILLSDGSARFETTPTTRCIFVCGIYMLKYSKDLD
jgi:hypothetical protein